MIDGYLFEELLDLLVNETVLTIVGGHNLLHWGLGIAV